MNNTPKSITFTLALVLQFLPALAPGVLLAGCSRMQEKNTDTSRLHGDSSKNVDIKITLPGIPAMAKVNIVGFYSDQIYLADTVLSKDGLIHYKSEKKLDEGLYYFSIPGRQEEYIQFFLDKDQEFEASAQLNDIVNTMEIKGSRENQLFYEFTRYENEVFKQLNKWNEDLKKMPSDNPEHAKLKSQRDELENARQQKIVEMKKNYPNSLFVNFKHGGQNPKVNEKLSKEEQFYKYRKEFWDNVDFSDARLLHTPMINNKLKRYVKELIPQHHDSLIKICDELMKKVLPHKEYFKVFANWIVLNYEPGKSTLMDAEALFVHMVQNYFTRERAFWQDSLTTATIQKRAWEMSHCLIGQKGPNVVSTDQYGRKQELLAKTADYLIVYMFNPDCEHCREETPKLHQYYLQHKDSVDVFGIALDTDYDEWKAYIDKFQLQWTNVFDPTNRSIYAKYYVDVTPEIYVLNKERQIIGKNLKTFQIPIVIQRDRERKKQG